MDGKDFDGPGICPACDMTLVPKPVQAAAPSESLGIEEGQFDVPEDRTKASSRRITLHYLRLPSTSASPGYPLVYLAGGPGNAGSTDFQGRAREVFLALRSVADVIILDPRGAGRSNAIPPCPMDSMIPDTFDLTRVGLINGLRRELPRCWQAWTAQGVEMQGYNVVEAAADIEDLRVALGAQKLNLFGASYGSHLAMMVLRQYGDHIDKVALGSLVGFELLKRPGPVDAVISRVAATLKANPETAVAYPDLMGLMRRVHARLDETPVRMTLSHDGRPITLVLDGFIVRMIGGQLMKHPHTWAQLPAFYSGLDKGKYEPFAQMLLHNFLNTRQPVKGMPEAIRLSSGVSPAHLAIVETEAKTAIIGDTASFPMPHLRGIIPGIEIGQKYRDPFRIKHSALLIGGTLDGLTPISEQQAIARDFDDATFLTIENGGHDVIIPETAAAMTAFFRGEKVSRTTLTLTPPRFVI